MDRASYSSSISPTGSSRLGPEGEFSWSGSGHYLPHPIRAPRDKARYVSPETHTPSLFQYQIQGSKGGDGAACTRPLQKHTHQACLAGANLNIAPVLPGVPTSCSPSCQTFRLIRPSFPPSPFPLDARRIPAGFLFSPYLEKEASCEGKESFLPAKKSPPKHREGLDRPDRHDVRRVEWYRGGWRGLLRRRL
ncbi:hypothetical protein VUR80DRAFT_10270 [Thermomyces stellatus]